MLFWLIFGFSSILFFLMGLGFFYFKRLKKLMTLFESQGLLTGLLPSFFTLNQRSFQKKTHGILERHVAKIHALETENQTLQKTFQKLNTPIWHMEKEDVTWFNPAFKALGFHESLPDIPLMKSGFTGDMPQRYSFNHMGKRLYYDIYRCDLAPDQGLFWGQEATQEETLSRKLRRHLSLYREVLETLSAGVVIYGPDNRLKFFNNAYVQMFHLDEAWLSESPTMGEVLDHLNRRRMLVENSNYPAVKQRELNMVAGLLTPFQELLYLPDERTIRKVTAPHPSGGVFYIFEDISTSLELERQYNVQLDVQKATLDHLFEGIAVFGPNNQLKFTNPAFKRLWGWRHPAEGSLHLSDLIEHVRPFLHIEGPWEAFKNKLISRVTDRIPKSRRLHLVDGTIIDFNYTPLPDGCHLIGFVDMTDHIYKGSTENESPDKKISIEKKP